MTFLAENHKVIVTLPSGLRDDHVPETASFDRENGSTHQARPIKKKSGKIIYRTTAFHVNRAILFVAALDKDRHHFFRQGKLISPEGFRGVLKSDHPQSEDLYRVGEELWRLGEYSVEHWIEQLRWISQSFLPRLSEQNFGMDMSNQYSFSAQDPDMHFNGLRGHFTVFMGNPLSSKTWKELESNIQNGFEIPIWHIYYCEANRKIFEFDYRGTIISAAISAEGFFRAKIELWIKKLGFLNDGLARRIRSMQIGDILKDIHDIKALDSLQLTDLEKKKIIQLFECRNRIMHGKVGYVNPTEAQAALGALQCLVGKK